MKISVFLLVLLGLSSVFATTAEEQLNEIDKDEFGRTMLDTIQLELEAKAPIDRLLSQLAYIESQLQADQRKSDKQHQEYQDKCDEDIRIYEEDIAKTKQKVLDLLQEISIKTALLNQKTKRRDQLLAYVRFLKASIKALQAIRRKEAKEFDRKVAEHQYATTVINQAKSIFDRTFKKGKGSFIQEIDEGSFVELKAHFDKAADFTYFKERESYAHIFKILAHISSSKKLKANTGMVARVYKIFDLLLSRIEDSLTQERRAEDARKRIFQKNVAFYNTLIGQSQREIAKLNAEIMALSQRLAEAKRELKEARERIVQKTKQMNDRIAECNDEAEAYNQERVKRNSKANIVSALIGLIQSQLRNIRSFVKRRKH